MICSSENLLLRIVRLLSGGYGLYANLEGIERLGADHHRQHSMMTAPRKTGSRCVSVGEPCSLSEKLPEATERQSEECRADKEQRQQLCPHDTQARTTEQHSLRKHDEVRIGSGKHDVLDHFRHAFTRRHAPRKHLKRQEDEH